MLSVYGSLFLTGAMAASRAEDRATTAMELGDVQVALDLGPTLDTTSLPTERRGRHALELARAYSARNRRDESLAVLLNA